MEFLFIFFFSVVGLVCVALELCRPDICLPLPSKLKIPLKKLSRLEVGMIAYT